MPKNRTTVTLDDDVIDALAKKRFEEPDWNFSRWINVLLRENLSVSHNPEIRKKRLELQLKKAEIDVLESAKRIEATKKAIANTDVSSIEAERQKRLADEWNEISNQICNHAKTLDGNIEELVDYFDGMAREYPRYEKEIGALYNMKSWRKTAGFIEK